MERDLPTIRSLHELAELLAAREALYVRWSKGPATDDQTQRSRDDLTEVELPGLSANPLAVEEWWGDRPLDLWVARRLYDYLHLRERRGPDVRPWILVGDEVGRGPDNEPLVRCREPVAWIADDVVTEAVEAVNRHAAEWGPLDRQAAAPEDDP